ncbi:protelomerase family protein [Nocardia suismassiliense]|uniref:protelomerase family protein n=1 Tax=Nocardia suismassiliense TaxID=2077092 RepID=UPI00131F3D9C|nr:protelomerase family protein [Nocardia suismassiliense]
MGTAAEGMPMLISRAEQERIAAFIDRLRELPTEKARSGAALHELYWIHTRKKRDGKRYSPDVNRKVIIAYRDAIRAAFGEDAPVLKTMHYSKARTDDYNARLVAFRTRKHHNLRPVNASEYITAGEEFIAKVVNESWSNAKAIAAVCGLTGRRPFEIACTGHFAPDPARPHYILFSGQAKTRDADRAQMTYSFPVLGARDHILTAVAKLRENFDPNMSNSEFSQGWAGDINKYARQVFHDAHGEEIKPRDLREAYVAIAVQLFAPSDVSDIQFMNTILGHKPGSLDTTTYYIGFTVV